MSSVFHKIKILFGAFSLYFLLGLGFFHPPFIFKVLRRPLRRVFIVFFLEVVRKKEKIENVRKQLLNGGNFAELARANSDCPSKEAGGDLNFIRRGQTVKPFEDAAFSQEKNVIGPVITTEYGYHIIQVLDRKPAKKIALEAAVKDKISAYLDKQKKSEAFEAVLKNLQQKAKIIVY